MTDQPSPNAARPKSAIADLAIDVAAIMGAALVVAGVWEIYQPAGMIVAGMFLLVPAWLAARKA
jgi:hypothetical protein